MNALFEMLAHFIFGVIWVGWMAGIAMLIVRGWNGEGRD